MPTLGKQTVLFAKWRVGCCWRIISVFLQNLAQLKIMYVWYSCYLQMKDIQFYISRHIFPTILYAPFPNDMKTNGRLFKLVKNRSITEYVKEKKKIYGFFFPFTSCAAKQLLQLVLYIKKTWHRYMHGNESIQFDRNAMLNCWIMLSSRQLHQ